MSASLSTSQADFLRPRETDGWRQGLILALVAHGLLVVALMLNMSWRTETREVVEAEVWAEVPVAARPTAPVMPPEPTPEPPPPAPQVPTPAPVPPPEPIPEPPPVPKAELSVERKPPPKPVKPVKPPKEFFEADPPQVKKRLEQAKPVPKPPEPKPVPPPKPAPPKPAPTPPAPPAVPAVKKPSPQEQARLERERQDRMNNIMNQLSGDSLSSAGPSAGYAGRIKARIKPNVVFTEDLPGNPLATVEVRCAPDGRIIGRRLLTRSGSTAWDDAVLRAIDRTEVLPLDEKGRIPAVMQIDFRPRDF